MAQDRADRLLRLAREGRYRARPGELVGERREREVHAGHAGDLRAPDPGAAHDDVGGDLALVGQDAGHLVFGPLDVEDFVAGEEAHAALGGPADLRLDGEDRLREAVRGHEEAGEDLVRVDERVPLDALLGAQQPGFDAPGGEPAVAPLQFRDALRAGRHLQAADLEEAGLTVHVERAELLDGVTGHLRHGLGGVGLEDQARGVRRRSPGGGQWALVDHGHFGPASRGDLIGERCSHDARSDDDHPGSRHRRTSDVESDPVAVCATGFRLRNSMCPPWTGVSRGPRRRKNPREQQGGITGKRRGPAG